MMERIGFNEVCEHIATDRGVSADVLRVQVDASIHEAFFKDDPEVKKWFEVLSAPLIRVHTVLGDAKFVESD